MRGKDDEFGEKINVSRITPAYAGKRGGLWRDKGFS